MDHENAYGSLTKNGTWTGMIALLVNGDVEVAVGDFTMNTQRTKAVDFTVPFSESMYGILILRTLLN
jgi:ABC-type amino acid transport substrate-binding protein